MRLLHDFHCFSILQGFSHLQIKRNSFCVWTFFPATRQILQLICTLRRGSQSIPTILYPPLSWRQPPFAPSSILSLQLVTFSGPLSWKARQRPRLQRAAMLCVTGCITPQECHGCLIKTEKAPCSSGTCTPVHTQTPAAFLQQSSFKRSAADENQNLSHSEIQMKHFNFASISTSEFYFCVQHFLLPYTKRVRKFYLLTG